MSEEKLSEVNIEEKKRVEDGLSQFLNNTVYSSVCIDSAEEYLIIGTSLKSFEKHRLDKLGGDSLVASYTHSSNFNSGSQMALDKRENLWFLDENGFLHVMDKDLKLISSGNVQQSNSLYFAGCKLIPGSDTLLINCTFGY